MVPKAVRDLTVTLAELRFSVSVRVSVSVDPHVYASQPIKTSHK